MEQKFTTMAQEVIGDAIQSASAAGNAQVETLHVMDALLRQENGVIQGLIQAAGGNPQAIGAEVRNALVKMPAASGSTTSQPQASRQLTAALAQAEKEMQQMGDEYVSTEHLLIGIAQAAPNRAADILKSNGVTVEALRKAVPQIRGGKKVWEDAAFRVYGSEEEALRDRVNVDAAERKRGKEGSRDAFAALARAFGGHGETVRTTADFAPAFERALRSGKPAILHLFTDPEAISTQTTLSALRNAL